MISGALSLAVRLGQFLLEREGDERWEAIVAEGELRAKFEAFLRESASEQAEPLDPNRL